ncbi:LOW QUALITY PROTEIN: beta-galactosidase 15-like [Primulina eburnea]|uniref:LOW QUALITY PROTEIN: beta-galactosidase 15-like n=1 Tax=Primulina eburnea TaxID=1245227 RepID=UPI003C6CBC8C
MIFSKINVLFHCFLLLILVVRASAADVSHDGRAITINGERKIIISGSIHYPRSTVEMWPDLIKKAKDGGLDAIETYVFWNAHEPLRRKYDFSGNLDLVRFIKTIQDAGLYAVLRIGPYVCAEWNYGGLPVWLHNLPGVELRTNNTIYMDEMQTFTSLIVNMMKKERLFGSQGGPIILAQIENEYGNVISSYGDAGKAYMNWCASMANSLNIGVPWIMCQEDDAPSSVINTCNGFYCDQFTPNNPNSPKMWTENWTGWFKSWGSRNPNRTPEDLAFSVARFFENGGTFQNYYMYHGGTNFGRTAGGPYITTSYDYDAPLNEYGTLNEPKYGHLKNLHDVLHSIEKIITYGDVNNTDLGYYNYATIYTLNGTSSCFLGNSNRTNDAIITLNGVVYDVPAWSVSILPDCKTEVYNSAKIGAQTSVMVKKPNEAEDEPSALEWKWKPEVMNETILLGKGPISTSKLVDQKAINDVSDYLWYMTSVNLDENDPIWSDYMILRVNGTGHILHAYLNGEYLGSQYGTYGVFNYKFEKKVKLKTGKNQITFLSATMGLQNYGGGYDSVGTGLPGPIEIISRHGDETIIKDLTNDEWSYKIGIEGLNDELFDDSHTKSGSDDQWQSGELPVDQMFTWYKTIFKAPRGDDPVVVDLLGLGKGLAWVNGNSLGRYWPSFTTNEWCQSDPCDYRGPFWEYKCGTGCGEPTQRYYHVPRSFLKDGDNQLVLFEEFGGNPSSVNFKTISVASACGAAYEHHDMELSCRGRSIREIKFASFGDVGGSCGSSRRGTCTSQKDALPIVQKACIGKESCTVPADEKTFGETECDASISKKLVVEALCDI